MNFIMCNIPDIVCKLESIDKSNVAISLSKIGKYYYYLSSIKYFVFDIVFPQNLPIPPFLLLHSPVLATPPILLTFL